MESWGDSAPEPELSQTDCEIYTERETECEKIRLQQVEQDSENSDENGDEKKGKEGSSSWSRLSLSRVEQRVRVDLVRAKLFRGQRQRMGRKEVERTFSIRSFNILFLFGPRFKGLFGTDCGGDDVKGDIRKV